MIRVLFICHGIIYALSSGEKRSCYTRSLGWWFYRERVWKGKIRECGGCFVSGIVAWWYKLNFDKIIATEITIFIGK